MEYNIPPGIPGVTASTGFKDNWLAYSAKLPGRGNPWDSSYSDVWRRAGKELRREITHLPHPLYTNSLTMSRIYFSAEQFSGDSGVRWSLGHDINIQFELYGCPNYDIDRSKCSVGF